MGSKCENCLRKRNDVKLVKTSIGNLELCNSCQKMFNSPGLMKTKKQKEFTKLSFDRELLRHA